jgi:prefoldin subunit 5
LVTEIRSFYSLKALSESLEEEINSYKAVVEEYSQRLGSFLREMETTHGNEEWFKKLSALQKSSKKEEGKGKKKSDLSNWIAFKDIMLSKDEQGEAQILFEAIEEINNKITRLIKTKETIEDLKKLGLGEDIFYVAYMRDEVPERIVLHKREEKETAEKFEFVATFSATKAS